MTGAETWILIICLGIGTFLIRFSFLGIIGDRALPPFVLKLLRYSPVALFSGMVAPLVLWPDVAGGSLDPARLSAAAMTLAVGVLTRNTVAAILSGGLTLYLGLWWLG